MDAKVRFLVETTKLFGEKVHKMTKKGYLEMFLFQKGQTIASGQQLAYIVTEFVSDHKTCYIYAMFPEILEDSTGVE